MPIGLLLGSISSVQIMKAVVRLSLIHILVGMFQGAIQALSRSYFAKIIPAEKSGEYFGIYDICGKGASFMGTTLVGIVAQVTNVANAGVGIIAVLFMVGFVLFHKAAKLNR